MITISSAAGIAYYASEISERFDYLSEGGRNPEGAAVWFGDLAKQFGFGGKVASLEDVIYLYCGFDPTEKTNPKALVRNANKDTLLYALLEVRRDEAHKTIKDGASEAKVAEAKEFLKSSSAEFSRLKGIHKQAGQLRKEREKIARKIRSAEAEGRAGEVDELRAELHRTDMRLKDAPGGARAGIDLTLSPPKTASLLMESATPDERERIAAALKRAQAETLEALLERAAFSRTGANGKLIKATAWAGASFTHYSARPTKGAPSDPSIHTHNLVFSPVVCEDEATRAILSDSINECRTTFDAMLNALSAKYLAELGYKTVAVQAGKTRSFRVCGISREQELEFSKRKEFIEMEMAARSFDGRPVDKKSINRDTRLKKDEPLEELREQWSESLAEAGIYARTIKNAEQEKNEFVVRSDAEIIEDLMEREAYFTELDILKELWDDATISGKIDQVDARLERIMESRDLLAISEDGRERLAKLSIGKANTGETIYTTKSMAARELALAEKVEKMASGKWGKYLNAAAEIERIEARKTTEARAKTPNAPEFRFREEQRALIGATLDSGQIFFVQASAGTGKTTTLCASIGIAEANGKKSIILAPSNAATEIAARETGKEFGKDAFTVSKLLIMIKPTDRELKRFGPCSDPPKIDHNTIIYVDEASMLSFSQSERLVNLSKETGCKLVFQGDKKQLPSVAKGRFFANSVDRLNINPATLGGVGTLEGITRQREAWAREAVKNASEGKFSEVIDAFESRGFVKEAGNRATLVRKIAEAHVADGSAPEQKLIVASTNNDCDAANAKVRELLKQQGRLADEKSAKVWDGERHKTIGIALGERIIFKEKAKGVKGAPLAQKSQLATVMAVEETKAGLRITARVDGKPGTIRFNTRDTEIGHGYAITTHKSQGATVDNCRVLHSEFASSELAYVAVSRHRNQCEIYVESSQREDMRWKMGRGLPKIEALDLLSADQVRDVENEMRRQIGLVNAPELPTQAKICPPHESDLSGRYLAACDLGIASVEKPNVDAELAKFFGQENKVARNRLANLLTTGRLDEPTMIERISGQAMSLAKSGGKALGRALEIVSDGRYKTEETKLSDAKNAAEVADIETRRLAARDAAKRSRGRECLDAAGMSDWQKVGRILAEARWKGIDLTIQDHQGRTVLHHLMGSPDKSIREVSSVISTCYELLKLEGKYREVHCMPDNSGKTPHQLAMMVADEKAAKEAREQERLRQNMEDRRNAIALKQIESRKEHEAKAAAEWKAAIEGSRPDKPMPIERWSGTLKGRMIGYQRSSANPLNTGSDWSRLPIVFQTKDNSGNELFVGLERIGLLSVSVPGFRKTIHASYSGEEMSIYVRSGVVQKAYVRDVGTGKIGTIELDENNKAIAKDYSGKMIEPRRLLPAKLQQELTSGQGR